VPDPSLVDVALHELSESGGGWVKLIFDFPEHFESEADFPTATSNYPPDLVLELCDRVHAAGGRVAAHVTGIGDGKLAVAAGVDSIEHGIDLSEDDIATLGDRGGAWTPTLTTVWTGIQQSPFARPLRDHLSAMLPRAVAAGVTVLAGTDATPAGTLAAEVALLAQLGLTPSEALAAATTSARRYLRLPADSAPGARPDLVTYHDDPREDLAVLQRPAAVIRKGVRIMLAD
jgi:imidazolonepropionase-like amidohydrolase